MIIRSASRCVLNASLNGPPPPPAHIGVEPPRITREQLRNAPSSMEEAAEWWRRKAGGE